MSLLVTTSFGAWTVPIWIAQAPYFMYGVVLALALTPIELVFIRRLRAWGKRRFKTVVLTSLAGAVGAVPCGIAVAPIYVFTPTLPG